MKITFLGAAGEVTGSQHLIETSSRRILLDCGFFQGPRAESRRKNEVFHCDPKRLDAVILSHAHLDHCGNLPRLRRLGFRGPIFCTDATADVTELMLLDSAKIQQEDAKYLSRKLPPGHPPVDPLYDLEDVDKVLRQFEPCQFNEWYSLAERDEVRIRFTCAGHILGSAITELEVKDEGESKRIVFTGDLGRRQMPLLNDPVPCADGADLLICESTYGDRIHSSAEDLQALLLKVFLDAEQKQGRIIIPAFSLGRTQAVVYFLNELFNRKLLPRIPIFVDSPLSTKVTQLFRRYQHTLDADVQQTIVHDTDPFHFETLRYIESQDESVALNRKPGAFVVIAASGMCEGGRVVHHIKHAVTDPRNTILLLGYQAPHTLGRQLAEHRQYVKIFGREHPLRAQVVQLDGLSAHADALDFKWWFEESTRRGHFGRVALVHGEPAAAAALAKLIRDHSDEEPVAPKFGETLVV